MTANEKLIQAAINCDVALAKQAFREGADILYRASALGVNEASALFLSVFPENSNHIGKKVAFLRLLIQQLGFNPELDRVRYSRDRRLVDFDEDNVLTNVCLQENTYALVLLLMMSGASAVYSHYYCWDSLPSAWPPALTRPGNMQMLTTPRFTNLFKPGAFREDKPAPALARERGFKKTTGIFDLFNASTKEEWDAANQFCMAVEKGDRAYINANKSRVKFSCVYWLSCILGYWQTLTIFQEKLKILASYKLPSLDPQEVAADLGHTFFFIWHFLLGHKIKINLDQIKRLMDAYDPQLVCDQKERLNQLIEASLATAYTKKDSDVLTLFLFCYNEPVFHNQILEYLSRNIACIIESEAKIVAWLTLALNSKQPGLLDKINSLVLPVVMERLPNLLRHVSLIGDTALAEYLLKRSADARWKDDGGRSSLSCIRHSGLPVEVKKKLIAAHLHQGAHLEDPMDPDLSKELNAMVNIAEIMSDAIHARTQGQRQLKAELNTTSQSIGSISAVVSQEVQSNIERQRMMVAVAQGQEVLRHQVEMLQHQMSSLMLMADQFQSAQPALVAAAAVPMITYTAGRVSVEERVLALERENRLLKSMLQDKDTQMTEMQGRVSKLEAQLERLLDAHEEVKPFAGRVGRASLFG